MSKTRASRAVGTSMKALYGLVTLAVLALLAFLIADRRVPELPDEDGPVSAPTGVYDPVAAGEPTPPGFRQLLGRDSIPPVYNPSFVDAGSIDWDDDTLVIGVEIEGEARAYPVSFLNWREMVIDRIGSTPVLVSW